MLHPAVTSIANTANKNSSWLGEAPTGYWIGNYVDSALLLILGGIPWQVNNTSLLSFLSVYLVVYLSLSM